MKKLFKKNKNKKSLAHVCAQRTRGFTLIEVLVSTSIFAIIVTMGIGAIFNMNVSYSNARTQQAVMDQLNFALESMARHIRTGSTYHCNPAGGLPQVAGQDCLGVGGTSFSFITYDGDQVVYRLGTAGQLERSVNSGNFTTMTPEQVTVNDLRFRVMGSAPYPDPSQPVVILSVAGSSTIRQETTEFNVQTTVTQRIPDLLIQ